MSWIVLVSGIIAAIAVATAIVARAANTLDAIPWATARRWIVIFPCIVLIIVTAFIAATIGPPGQFAHEQIQTLKQYYVALPTTTLLFISAAATFLTSLFALILFGFWPQPHQPYRPRAADWNRRHLRYFAAMALFGLAIAIVLQDFELRWRLRQMETKANELAQTLAPSAVPDADIAAIYYQRLMDNSKQLDAVNDEYRNARNGLDVCACDGDHRKQYFNKIAAELGGFQEAAARKSCRFDDEHAPVDLLDAGQLRAELMDAEHTLIWLANSDVCQQRSKEACSLLRAVRRSEEHLASDPRGTETVHYFWLDAWTCHVAEQMATYCNSISEEDARSLMLGPLDVNRITKIATTWEAAVFQMHIVKTYDGRNDDRPDMSRQLIHSRIGRALQLGLMRLLYGRDDMRSMYAFYPFLQQPQNANAWDRVDLSEVFPRGFLLPTILTSAWAGHWVTQANGWRQLTNIALAAALYRQKNGEWPDAMERLVPDLLPQAPIDPLSNQPYHWINIEGGVVVYSDLDAEAFSSFSGNADDWLNLENGQIWGSIFLGTAYKAYSSAGYIDPNDPCTGEPR